MEADARATFEHGATPEAFADASGFANTAELLEARVGLAAAQARRPA